ncbi:MAG TPA: methyl-accepting chemotaxis protein, partial [Baekduia sp.]|nr:methyl-accepting chemotaxis protein [Baekduia sp.]
MTFKVRRKKMTLTVRRKLLAGFLAIMALMVASAFIGLQQMSKLNERTERIGNEIVPNVTAIGQIRQEITAIQARQESAIAPTATDNLREFWRGETDDAAKRVDALFVVSTKRVGKGNELDLLKAAQLDWESYRRDNEAVLGLIAAGKIDAAVSKVSDRNSIAFKAILASTGAWSEFADRQARQATTQASDAFASGRTELIALVAIGLLIAIGIALLLSRHIVRALNQLMYAADGIAKGEVDQEISIGGRDEFGQLARSFEGMIANLSDLAGAAGKVADGDLTVRIVPKSDRDQLGNAFAGMTANLNDVIGRVSDVSGQVSASAQQMAASSDETGRAMGEVATAISEVAAGSQRQVISLESADQASTEVATSSEVSAQHAQETASAAQEARQIAQEGEAAVAGATEAMGAIRDASEATSTAITTLGAKSQEIGGIVDTITT